MSNNFTLIVFEVKLPLIKLSLLVLKFYPKGKKTPKTLPLGRVSIFFTLMSCSKS